MLFVCKDTAGESETLGGETPVDEEQFERDIMWLKANSRNATNEVEIVLRMKRTFQGRRNYITGAVDRPTPTIEEILIKFPRFMDTDGLVW